MPDPKRIALPTGVTLAYVDAGERAAPSLILLHGMTDSWRSFERVLTYLPRSLRSVAPSQRGHGDSDKPLSKDAYHDPARWANDLHSVIRATGADRPCVVAWSYGGRVLNDYLSVFGDGGLGALNYAAATSSAERL